MAPPRSLQSVLVMRSERKKVQDTRMAQKVAIDNIFSTKTSIAQRMCTDAYHCRYAKQFFHPTKGTRMVPANMATFDRFWMFHKPHGCSRTSTSEQTSLPSTKAFIDATMQKENENRVAKDRVNSCHVVYELPKHYSGIVLCKFDAANSAQTSILDETLGIRGNVEILFHCMYPYIPQYHDRLLNKLHSIDIPNTAPAAEAESKAVAQIVSIGRGTRSLQYWISERESTSNNSTNKYVLVEVSAPVIGGKPPCIETILHPLMRVNVMDYPRTMIHAVKLSVDVFDGTNELIMTSTAMNSFADIEYNQSPSFSKFYLTEKHFDDLMTPNY